MLDIDEASMMSDDDWDNEINGMMVICPSAARQIVELYRHADANGGKFVKQGETVYNAARNEHLRLKRKGWFPSYRKAKDSFKPNDEGVLCRQERDGTCGLPELLSNHYKTWAIHVGGSYSNARVFVHYLEGLHLYSFNKSAMEKLFIPQRRPRAPAQEHAPVEEIDVSVAAGNRRLALPGIGIGNNTLVVPPGNGNGNVNAIFGPGCDLVSAFASCKTVNIGCQQVYQNNTTDQNAVDDLAATVAQQGRDIDQQGRDIETVKKTQEVQGNELQNVRSDVISLSGELGEVPVPEGGHGFGVEGEEEANLEGDVAVNGDVAGVAAAADVRDNVAPQAQVLSLDEPHPGHPINNGNKKQCKNCKPHEGKICRLEEHKRQFRMWQEANPQYNN